MEPSDIVPLPAVTDPGKARVVLYQTTRLGHAPLDQIGLLTTTDASTTYLTTTDAAATYDLQTAEARNRIVNGAMQVSQENLNTAASAVGYYAADQWTCFKTGTPADVYQQRVQAVTPNKSVNRLQITLGAADAAVAAGNLYEFYQFIEGIRVADFGWGTAGARQIVLRFGWKSPAGTYGISLHNSAGDRTYLTTFTISAGQANTDTEQVLVIPGDTTGTWLTDTSVGLQLAFCLMGGTTWQGTTGWQAGNLYATAACSNGLASTSNVFNIYDVGLYLDPDATGIAPKWVMPDEAQELAACQRYWQAHVAVVETGALSQSWAFPVPFRNIPAITGGSSGFTIANSAADMCWVYQTSRASNALQFNARM